MYLLSTGRKTVLSDFADLETKSTYIHANGESTDFQFNAQRRVFVEVNRKSSGLEVMRIKERSSEQIEIQRVRKLTIDNVYSVGCGKQTVEEIAVGMSSGHIKIYNYKTTQLLHRFQADNTRNTVLYLDYNCTDEYIASVQENGDVNIYGTKTKTKIETIKFDANSTLARFHPSKRFQLSVASYKGGVTVYDVQAKRKIFNSCEAHDAPCRDLCMCISNPYTLVSVGYDCRINIFDIRRKAQAPNSAINYTLPLSTVALSDCGTFLCVGNLKGDIITYDMRNTKNYLASRKVHDCAVSRVGFVPTPGESANSFSSNCSTITETADTKTVNAQVQCIPSGRDVRKPDSTNRLNVQSTELGLNTAVASCVATPAAGRGNRDSFCDFLDLQSNKVLERMSTRLTMRRDSFDWEALTRKTNNEENRYTNYQTNSGLSSIDSTNSSGADSLDCKLSSTGKSAEPLQIQTEPLRDRSNVSNISHQNSDKLKQINEEHSTQARYSMDSSMNSDKENPQPELELPSRLSILPSNRNSTPHQDHGRKAMDGLIGTGAMKGPSVPISSNTLSSTESSEIRNELNKLRHFMDDRLTQLECELKYVAEANKWQIFSQASNLWNQQIDTTREIHEGVAMLLQTDNFIKEFMRLQNENRALKFQLDQLQQNLKPQEP